MKVLAVESSCDETAVAIVEDGTNIMSNEIASQIDIHARYGGVVPEVASRQHLLSIVPTYRQALDKSGLTLDSVDAIAVTNGPGLAGSLLVGVNFAKALALGQASRLSPLTTWKAISTPTGFTATRRSSLVCASSFPAGIRIWY